MMVDVSVWHDKGPYYSSFSYKNPDPSIMFNRWSRGCVENFVAVSVAVVAAVVAVVVAAAAAAGVVVVAAAAAVVVTAAAAN